MYKHISQSLIWEYLGKRKFERSKETPWLFKGLSEEGLQGWGCRGNDSQGMLLFYLQDHWGYQDLQNLRPYLFKKSH